MKVVDFLLQNLSIKKQTKYHVEAECPVCKGKLKISLSPSSYGAYKCWTNNCRPKDIKETLGIPKLSSTESPFSRSKIFDNDSFLSIQAKDFENIDLCKILSYVPLKQDLQVYINAKKQVRQRIFPYSRSQRILRVDEVGVKKKQVYIQYWSDEGWKNGVGEDTWELYSYGLENNITEKSTIIFVEGEKTCEFVKQSGWAAITCMSSIFYSKDLFLSLILFKKKFPHIQNILYFPDDDAAGYKKAEYVETACAKAKLGFKVKNISSLNLKNLSGFDLADIEPTYLKHYLSSLC